MEKSAVLLIFALLAGLVIVSLLASQPAGEPKNCSSLAAVAGRQKALLASPEARACTSNADCLYSAIGISGIGNHCALCVSSVYEKEVRTLGQTYRDAAAYQCDALTRDTMKCAISYTGCGCIQGRCTEQP